MSRIKRLEHRMERLEIARLSAEQKRDYCSALVATRLQITTMRELIAEADDRHQSERVAALVRSTGEVRTIPLPEN